MISRLALAVALAGILGVLPSATSPLARACCPAPPSGKPVVNADQTVIMIWDAASKVQHFIRKATFTSAADDFGFLVPTPSQPELEESGNDAFPYLFKLTEPEVKKVPRPSGVSCGCTKSAAPDRAVKSEPQQVKVLLEKEVAGFQAVVLETKSATALVDWLKKNGYAYSPEIQAWAKPYVEGGWKITALKVAKGKDAKSKDAKSKDDKDGMQDSAGKSVAAAALRITFKTDRPLFPYREPDPKSFAETLQAKRRLLRIYFLAEARYQGDLTKAAQVDAAWSGKTAWAGKLRPEDRKRLLDLLKLPETTGPAEWWLTEFEDNWAYQAAPGDVYFSTAAHQEAVKRPPIIIHVSSPWPRDVMACALAIVVGVPVWRRFRRR